MQTPSQPRPKYLHHVMDNNHDINSYVAECRAKAKQPKASIRERYNNRIVQRGLDKQGKAGAQAYLQSYGKGIGAAKLKDLATAADFFGANELAAGFYEAAYSMETGQSAVLAVNGSSAPTSHNGNAPVTAPSRQSEPTAITFDGLPADLQPGRISTMQPVDSPHSRDHFIIDPNYVGQPKRDGHRNIVIATPKGVFHQSRSTNDLGSFDPAFDKAIMAAASDLGPFVLDGERYHLSASGAEHRTAAQAATANIHANQHHAPIVTVYAVFEALYANNADLRTTPKVDRIASGAMLTEAIANHLAGFNALHRCRIEAVPTAATTADKKKLCETQLAEGREGEVWTRLDSTYIAGKSHGASFRTKYVSEDTFRITSVTKGTDTNRPLKSFDVEWPDGTPAGSVGTGFDRSLGQDIINSFEADPTNVKAEIRYQGTTESKVLWHPRLLSLKR